VWRLRTRIVRSLLALIVDNLIDESEGSTRVTACGY
jgi:hypothetical protein